MAYAGRRFPFSSRTSNSADTSSHHWIVSDMLGVPFEQKEYFPKDFKGMNRLSELLTITADWPKHSKRRALLIKREYDHGSLSAKEEAELESLQRRASLRRNFVAPIDRSELDASIKRLKLLGQWDE